jgi:hypothetical protein
MATRKTPWGATKGAAKGDKDGANEVLMGFPKWTSQQSAILKTRAVQAAYKRR